ncbi:GTP diphosphokinase [Gilvimarinus sp. F26214L]|uniref:GTP diphosphokinase n=1 Tax=Gilvimarinus sp. DZF01 TaxID=3461371 RepID=UPI0040455651
MVKVREDHPIAEDGNIDIEAWIGRIAELVTLDRHAPAMLQRALLLCKQAEDDAIASAVENAWADGQSCYRTGMEMAEILAELQLDLDTVVASILYRAVREKKLALSRVSSEFNESVATIIRGVIRMAAISQLRNDSDRDVFGRQSEEQAGKVRKMLVAMVDDVRVALVKLAERTCAIRAVKNASEEKRRRVAKEVADVYAPLAHRLGIGHIKWELEDLSFRYLEPADYKQIAKLLDEKRLDRQRYIEQVIRSLHRELDLVAIKADISGRAKHIYSIWRKMRRKGIGFSQVYDIRAVRILVDTVRDCYGVLGVVHSLWRNIPNEFDDYIASPKENGYRSLHTAVIGPEGKVLEIQIRTYAMHEEAEYGVCSHWRYKGTDTDINAGSYEEKIAWLRQVLEWHDELGSTSLSSGLADHFKQDSIYVFTPEGHIVDLPEGSTPVDFAYRIHTDVGNRCRGAKVNGRIVPLNYHLRTADQVEILTGKREAPSRDWLLPALGYINTSRARAKVQQWFKLQARDQNIADGRALLDKEFKRLALVDFDFEALAKKLNMTNLESLYAAVGAHDIGVGQVLNAAQRMLPVNPNNVVVPLTGKATVQHAGGSDVYIEGVGNLLTNIARCCRPLPGDAISGYITIGKGVSIHRQDCRNILKLQEKDSDRVIKVEWGKAPENTYAVAIAVEAYDRHGLLRDITSLLDNERINVSAMQTQSDKRKNTVDMVMTLEVRSYAELSRILAKLNQLPNVAMARRKT